MCRRGSVIEGGIEHCPRCILHRSNVARDKPLYGVIRSSDLWTLACGACEEDVSTVAPHAC